MVNTNQLFNIANLRNIAVHTDAINLDCKKATTLPVFSSKAGSPINLKLRLILKTKKYEN
jgi:hypothetical protein